MPTVYLETTIPSYLAAYPSSEVVYAGHQKITHEWWKTAAERFRLFISEHVLDEIRDGDPDAARRRLEFIDGLPVLTVNDDVRELTREYNRRLGLQGRGLGDIPHFAFAVSYKMDYLVTWNCRHIANAVVIGRLSEANEELGRSTPQIITPEALSDPFNEGEES